MSTTTRAEELTAQFEAINHELVTTLNGCSAAEWSARTAAEGWTVAATAHHVAIVQRGFARLVGTLAAGDTFTPTMTIAQLNEVNDRHAEEYAAADQQETLDILRTSRDELLELFRRFTDSDLERLGGTFGGNELSVAQVLENIIIGHPDSHLASIRATLDAYTDEEPR